MSSTTVLKFSDPERTLDGKTRASVELVSLKTLWFNTGTLCNLTCKTCYIESSPKNDALVYLTAREVDQYLEEITTHRLGTQEIGFTGGEPFMNPQFMEMLESCLQRGFRVLVLTNAMRPMMKQKAALRDFNVRYPQQLTLRVSIDHFDPRLHDEERGLRTFGKTLLGLRWLQEQGIPTAVAGRTRWGGTEGELRNGFRALFEREQIALDCDDPAQLVLFPEMDLQAPVPEITTECWSILNKSPSDLMCASARMVVKRKGAMTPSVVACTLLPYDKRFDCGERVADALGPIKLNHQHCAKFCVLGGGRCSA